MLAGGGSFPFPLTYEETVKTNPDPKVVTNLYRDRQHTPGVMLTVHRKPDVSQGELSCAAVRYPLTYWR